MDFYIRPIEAGDAKGINQIRRMPGVFENLPAIPSERVSRSTLRAWTTMPIILWP